MLISSGIQERKWLISWTSLIFVRTQKILNKFLNIHTLKTMILDLKHANNYVHVRLIKILNHSGTEYSKWLKTLTQELGREFYILFATEAQKESSIEFTKPLVNSITTRTPILGEQLINVWFTMKKQANGTFYENWFHILSFLLINY